MPLETQHKNCKFVKSRKEKINLKAPFVEIATTD